MSLLLPLSVITQMIVLGFLSEFTISTVTQDDSDFTLDFTSQSSVQSDIFYSESEPDQDIPPNLALSKSDNAILSERSNVEPGSVLLPDHSKCQFLSAIEGHILSPKIVSANHSEKS